VILSKMAALWDLEKHPRSHLDTSHREKLNSDLHRSSFISGNLVSKISKMTCSLLRLPRSLQNSVFQHFYYLLLFLLFWCLYVWITTVYNEYKINIVVVTVKTVTSLVVWRHGRKSVNVGLLPCNVEWAFCIFTAVRTLKSG
jgi:hypothetical protein